MKPLLKPKNSSNPCAFGLNSGFQPRCHLPTSAVAYPAPFSSCGRDRPEGGSPRSAVLLRLRAEGRLEGVALLIAPADQAGPGRRAGGAVGVEVGQPDAVPGQAVDVRRLDVRSAVDAEIAVAGVVRHDQDDVRAFRRRRLCRQHCRRAAEHQRDSHGAEQGTASSFECLLVGGSRHGDAPSILIRRASSPACSRRTSIAPASSRGMRSAHSIARTPSAASASRPRSSTSPGASR